jgi:hypothetical protein
MRQLFCRNGSRFVGLVGRSNNKVALRNRYGYVGCSAGFLSAHVLYEPIIQDRVDPTSEIRALCRQAPHSNLPAPSVAER